MRIAIIGLAALLGSGECKSTKDETAHPTSQEPENPDNASATADEELEETETDRLPDAQPESEASARKKLERVTPQGYFLVRNLDRSAEANPGRILGRIVAVKAVADEKGMPTCSSPAIEYVAGLRAPPNEVEPAQSAQLIKSLTIKGTVAAKLQALTFVSTEFNQESVLNLVVAVDSAGSVRDDEKWREALDAKRLRKVVKEYVRGNPSVCNLMVATGYWITSATVKEYTKIEAGGEGGAYGVKIGGKLYSSNESFARSTAYYVRYESVYWAKNVIRAALDKTDDAVKNSEELLKEAVEKADQLAEARTDVPLPLGGRPSPADLSRLREFLKSQNDAGAWAKGDLVKAVQSAELPSSDLTLFAVTAPSEG